MPLVGAVGERMGLPCNPESAYTTARHKHNAREALRKAGIATPQSHLMKAAGDADAVIAKVSDWSIVRCAVAVWSLRGGCLIEVLNSLLSCRVCRCRVVCVGECACMHAQATRTPANTLATTHTYTHTRAIRTNVGVAVFAYTLVRVHA